MIEEINIAQVASYGNNSQHLNTLSDINYIYGANGAGKTTISKIISNPADHPTCKILWKNGRTLDTFVYNRDFVGSNFSQDSIKGIFTLGSESQEIQDKINELNSKRTKEQGDLVAKEKLLNSEENDSPGVLKRIFIAENNFKEECWKQKKKHDGYFSKAFEGVRNNAENFKSRVLKEHFENNRNALPLEVLTDMASKVYSSTLQHSPLIPSPDISSLNSITDNPLWQEKIIGKDDSIVSNLIKKLNNSDWVKQGLFYHDKLDSTCPFCQQPTPHNLKENLESYFDETYEKHRKLIEKFSEEYKASYEILISYIKNIKDNNSNSFLNIESFDDKSELLKAKLLINMQKIERKKSELSEAAHLDNISELVKDFLDVINQANNKIIKNNELLANLDSEQKNLTKNIWSYIVKIELKDEIPNYLSNLDRLSRTKEGLKSGAIKNQENIDELSTLIADEEKKQTSVNPTIVEINKILSSFGFKNFELTPSEDNFHYKITRLNGDSARETLSEGEKTFLTFLYFYNLISGSNTSSGITTDRVVVFDDPISSLDSDILFIVSTLIKKLIKQTQDKDCRIKQIFCLTHNIYFHKELTFDIDRNGNQARKHETFWIVRKKDNISILEKHSVNPIKNSYDLLWSEVRKSDNEINCTTIQNTLRRILENYFKILGGIDIWKLESYFDGDEKFVFKALSSWINDGSHYSNDDLYITQDINAVRKNIIIFQKIFEYSDNTAHYKMMMGEFYKPLPQELEIDNNLDFAESANDTTIPTGLNTVTSNALPDNTSPPF